MSASDNTAQYLAAIQDAGGIGIERICKHCGFKNDSGMQADKCQQCGKFLPMTGCMRAEEKAVYEGLLVELAMQGQQYAQHVWGNYTNEVGGWVSYEPNPCLLNGCPCATKFLKGTAELCGGRADLQGAKTQFLKCDTCQKARGQHCDDCLGTGQRIEATWGRLKAKWCWHGTGSNDVYCLICHDSLRPDLRSGQAYGSGEYFGVNPIISRDYARGTGRQLVCWVFTGEVTSGGCAPGFETKHAGDSGHRGGMKSAIFNHAPGFCYVVNNPGGRGAMSGREKDRTVMYCIPVGIVTYNQSRQHGGDGKPPPSLNWSKLSCGAAILGARSTWDLPEFTHKLEYARRMQVKIQREEQLMWAYIHYEKGVREEGAVAHFNKLFREWSRSHDKEADSRWRLREAEKKAWDKDVKDSAESAAMKQKREMQRAAEEQKKRAVLEKRVKTQLAGLMKIITKTLDGHTMLRSVQENTERFTDWEVEFIAPSGSPFFDFPLRCKMEFPLQWPNEPPTLRFKVQLFHPNVNGHNILSLPIQKKWDDEFAKPKAQPCFEAIVEAVIRIMKFPDFLDTSNGSLAKDFDPDEEGYKNWWHAAAAHHGLDTDGFGRQGSSEEYGGAAQPLERRPSGGRRVSGPGGDVSPAPVDRGIKAHSTFTEFVQRLDEREAQLRDAIEKRRREMLGDKMPPGSEAEYAALVRVIEAHRDKFLAESAGLSTEYRGMFLAKLKEFRDQYVIPTAR